MNLKSQRHNWNQMCKLFLHILISTFISIFISLSPFSSLSFSLSSAFLCVGFFFREVLSLYTTHPKQWYRLPALTLMKTRDSLFLLPWQNSRTMFHWMVLIYMTITSIFTMRIMVLNPHLHLHVTVTHIRKRSSLGLRVGGWWLPKCEFVTKWRGTDAGLANHNDLPHMLKSFPCMCQVFHSPGFWCNKQ